MSELEIEGRVLRLSTLDRLLWPQAAFTKGNLLEYLRAVAPALLPHVRGRPLTLLRCPEGVDASCWFQTECRGEPAWVRTCTVGGRTGRPQRYCVLDDLPGLLWAANLGAVELHPLLARAESLDEPTGVVFDLDPGPPAGLAECAAVALLLRDSLAVESFVKTSGSLGLHVVVPLNAPHSYAQTKAFARAVAAELAARHPHLVVDRQARALRAGKVLVDWGQNDRVRSTVAPYSPRALPWPLVSTPLTWDEVERGDLRAFGPGDVLARLDRHGDLFAPVAELRQRLPQPG